MGFRVKLLLGLLTVWSVQGFAQNTCSSVWVYKPYEVCQAAGSPDLSVAGQFVRYEELNTGKLEGAQDELGLCQMLLADFNGQQGNRAAGLVATLTSPGPVRNVEHGKIGRIKHTYYCGVNVNQHPVVKAASASCGSSERYSYQIGGAAPQDNAQCLSCDSLDGANINDLTVCLQNNIRDIINTRAVELREGDLAPVRQKVRQIQKINCTNPVASLQSLDQISLFMDFAGSVTCR